MKIESFASPALAIIDGQKYIMPLWKKVPMSTTLADIEWIKPNEEVKPENSVELEKFVEGSKGNEYLVRLYKDGRGECECWGYIRHKKDCKHIRYLRGMPLPKPSDLSFKEVQNMLG